MATGYLTDLADVCRKAGLKVKEVDGWKTRGHGRFVETATIVCHHTAGPASGNMPSLGVVTNGRAGLSGPLCNLGLGRDGTVYIVAAGYGYHAGVVRRFSYGNAHAIGIEAEATGTSSWPEEQYQAYATLCKALCDHYGIPVSRVLGHKEVCFPPRRKTDPNFNMDTFRDAVRNASTSKDWFDMADKSDLEDILFSDKFLNAIATRVTAQLLDGFTDDGAKKTGGKRNLGSALVNIHNMDYALVKEGRLQTSQILDTVKEAGK